MTDLDEKQRWINAAIVLGRNPSAKVSCPVCGEANLMAKDIPFEGIQVEGAAQKFERVLYCQNCGAKNYLLMNTKH
jgi:C4-type Zn-finger protein